MVEALQFSGIFSIKLPVRELDRSRVWYERVFGYVVDIEFPDDDGYLSADPGSANKGRAIFRPVAMSPRRQFGIPDVSGCEPLHGYGHAVGEPALISRIADRYVRSTVCCLSVTTVAEPSLWPVRRFARARNGVTIS